jgi:hypothetical protein
MGAASGMDIQGEGILQGTGEAHGGTFTGGGYNGAMYIGSNAGATTAGVNWTLITVALIGGIFAWLIMRQPRRRR